MRCGDQLLISQAGKMLGEGFLDPLKGRVAGDSGCGGEAQVPDRYFSRCLLAQRVRFQIGRPSDAG